MKDNKFESFSEIEKRYLDKGEKTMTDNRKDMLMNLATGFISLDGVFFPHGNLLSYPPSFSTRMGLTLEVKANFDIETFMKDDINSVKDAYSDKNIKFNHIDIISAINYNAVKILDFMVFNYDNIRLTSSLKLSNQMDIIMLKSTKILRSEILEIVSKNTDLVYMLLSLYLANDIDGNVMALIDINQRTNNRIFNHYFSNMDLEHLKVYMSLKKSEFTKNEKIVDIFMGNDKDRYMANCLINSITDSKSFGFVIQCALLFKNTRVFDVILDHDKKYKCGFAASVVDDVLRFDDVDIFNILNKYVSGITSDYILRHDAVNIFFSVNQFTPESAIEYYTENNNFKLRELGMMKPKKIISRIFEMIDINKYNVDCIMKNTNDDKIMIKIINRGFNVLSYFKDSFIGPAVASALVRSQENLSEMSDCYVKSINNIILSLIHSKDIEGINILNKEFGETYRVVQLMKYIIKTDNELIFQTDIFDKLSSSEGLFNKFCKYVKKYNIVLSAENITKLMNMGSKTSKINKVFLNIIKNKFDESYYDIMNIFIHDHIEDDKLMPIIIAYSGLNQYVVDILKTNIKTEDVCNYLSEAIKYIISKNEEYPLISLLGNFSKYIEIDKLKESTEFVYAAPNVFILNILIKNGFDTNIDSYEKLYAETTKRIVEYNLEIGIINPNNYIDICKQLDPEAKTILDTLYTGDKLTSVKQDEPDERIIYVYKNMMTLNGDIEIEKILEDISVELDVVFVSCSGRTLKTGIAIIQDNDSIIQIKTNCRDGKSRGRAIVRGGDIKESIKQEVLGFLSSHM